MSQDAIEPGNGDQLLVEAAQRDSSRFADLYEQNFTAYTRS